MLTILRLFDRLLHVLVPPRPHQITWTSTPDYVGNAYHLYRHLVTTRTDLEHVWLVQDTENAVRIMEEAAHLVRGHQGAVRVVPRRTPRGYWAFLRSRWVFHTHGVYRTTRWTTRRHIVSLYHGMPIKRVGWLHSDRPRPTPAFGTLHLATSHFFRYVIATAFRARIDDVLIAGLPRCDVLTAPSPHAPGRAELRDLVGVPPGRRLVVWMPTWRTSSVEDGGSGARTFLDDVDDDTWQDLDTEAEARGCVIVVKLHPYDILNHDGRELGLDNVRLLRSHEWLRTGVELYDLLAVADGLISDVSSVLIDWLSTRRPLGTVGFDPDTYTRDVTLPIDTLTSSSRIHDLSSPAGVRTFFSAVAAGDEAMDDDLSGWLYSARAGGCDAVLQRVGL